ncbi:MAG: hypothetical protein HOM52_00080 [Rhodospirillaceae bacterium]|nr:hypothetical protein [Rhodospirillaceae bacterium]MBT4428231.1 hypothetical protein [Rhodospirillaceae bacterium]MBT5036880.1 hypothetical protein [Rhodospirillaceae bacterium]MBT5675127.1 hypothetical protein [Rhodospirillaceae bacterium]MBT5778884.1 hypothetical protein [Rhodospirillaceae bacterium]
MIRINKPGAPKILRKRGAAETVNHCADFDASKHQYEGGTKTFDFNSGIYGAKSVKNALIKAQHKKCCFCESKVTHVAYGDVEHFRPKGGFRQLPDDELGRPGYYWLAYDWENLYFSCQLCNQRHKKNLFPLSNPTRRARSHHEDLSREQPEFIDPGKVDPGQFISFRKEYPYAIDNNTFGKTTISELGLDRKDLEEKRRDHLELLKAVDALAALDRPESDEARQLLQRHLSDKAEYSAMARAEFPNIGVET